jgi:hypothetical protein
MANMVICDSCGMETDIASSPICSNCGAVVNLNSVSDQEIIVPPKWGVMTVSTIKLSEKEKSECLKLLRDIWFKVELSLLSTLLPSQGKMLLEKNDRYELLCHSGAAYKVEQDLKASEFKDNVNIEFKEIDEDDLEEMLKILNAQ